MIDPFRVRSANQLISSERGLCLDNGIVKCEGNTAEQTVNGRWPGNYLSHLLVDTVPRGRLRFPCDGLPVRRESSFEDAIKQKFA